MKCIALLFSFLVVTLTAAQKPLDRGIHKRKTGGVSLLFGDNNNRNNAKDAFDVAAELEPLPPVAFSTSIDPGRPLTCPLCMEHADVANATTQRPRVLRFLLPLNARRLSPVAGSSVDRRLFRRARPSIPVPKRDSAAVDRVSLAALVFIVLGLLALAIYSGAFPYLNRLAKWIGHFWGREWFVLSLLSLGFMFGFLGLRRTKRGRRRGRILALVSFILGSFLPLSGIVLLLVLLSEKLSLPL